MSNQPSNSPLNPQAKMVDEFFAQIMRSQMEYIDTRKVSDEIFGYLYDAQNPVTNHDFLKGNIALSNKDKNLDLYIKIMNGLIKIAMTSNSGAHKKLTPELVSSYDDSKLVNEGAQQEARRSVALAKCMGGTKLLETLCMIVNGEIAERPSGYASQSKGSSLQQNLSKLIKS